MFRYLHFLVGVAWYTFTATGFAQTPLPKFKNKKEDKSIVLIEMCFIQAREAIRVRLPQHFGFPKMVLPEPGRQEPGLVIPDRQMREAMEFFQGDRTAELLHQLNLKVRDGQTGHVWLKENEPYRPLLRIGLDLEGGKEAEPAQGTDSADDAGISVEMSPRLLLDKESVRLRARMVRDFWENGKVPRKREKREEGIPAQITILETVPVLKRIGMDGVLTIPLDHTMVCFLGKKVVEVRTEVETWPFLARLPLIGHQFRSVGVGREEIGLFVLLTVRLEEPRKAVLNYPVPPVEFTGPLSEPRDLPEGQKPTSIRELFFAPKKRISTSEATRSPILPPIKKGERPTCDDSPELAEILRALSRVEELPGFEVFRDDIQVAMEKLVDAIDPPRFFPLIGPAQMHRCAWKCTVRYQETVEWSFLLPLRVTRPRTEVVFLDKDHLHLVEEKDFHLPKQVPVNKQGVQAEKVPRTGFPPLSEFLYFFKKVPPLFFNVYSEDPNERMKQLLEESKELRQIQAEWDQFWIQTPSPNLRPIRVHGGIGP